MYIRYTLKYIIYIFIPTIYKAITLILTIGKKYLIIFLINFRLYKIFYNIRLVYYFVIDNKSIKIIN